jgi:hypothetical protein
MSGKPQFQKRMILLILPLIVVGIAVTILLWPENNGKDSRNPEQSTVGDGSSDQTNRLNINQAKPEQLSKTVKELQNFTGTSDKFTKSIESVYRTANKVERTFILDLCGTRMDEQILTLLGKLQLTETNPDLRWRIVQMIANASGEKGNEILISNLGHYDTGVALASLKVLRERKPVEAVPKLIKYLNRSDVKERWIAVDILADIRTEEAISAIEKCAVNPNMEKKARLRAITALGKLKAKTSRQALEKNLTDKDPQIRKITQEVIKVLE